MWQGQTQRSAFLDSAFGRMPYPSGYFPEFDRANLETFFLFGSCFQGKWILKYPTQPLFFEVQVVKICNPISFRGLNERQKVEQVKDHDVRPETEFLSEKGSSNTIQRHTLLVFFLDHSFHVIQKHNKNAY